MKHKIARILIVMFVAMLFAAPVCYAEVSWGKDGIYNSDPNLSGLTETELRGMQSVNSVYKVWNTIRYILQVAAVGAFIFAGVRYMFASAEQKADLKKSMGILAIGAVLVFGATLVIGFIQTIVADLAS